MENSKQFLPSDKEPHCLHAMTRTWMRKSLAAKIYKLRSGSSNTHWFDLDTGP